MATATVSSDKQIDTSVVAEARALQDDFLLAKAAYSRRAILTALADNIEFNLHEFPTEKDGIISIDPPSGKEQTIGHTHLRKRKGNNAAIFYRTLCSISALELPRRHPVIIPLFEQLPPYTTWAPVYKNFLIKTPAETYLPFFGNEDDHVILSHKALQMMEKEEAKKCALDMPSDGEVDEVSGFFAPRGFVDEMSRNDTLADVRNRAAARHVVMHIIPKYGEGIKTVNSVRDALKLPDIKTVMAHFKLAERRFVEERKQEKLKKCTEIKTAALDRVLRHPNKSDRHPWNTPTLNSLIHFCFTCQEFICDLHEEHRPIPILPIPDECQRIRLLDMGFGSHKPCSQSCFATKGIDRCPLVAHEQQQWDDDEVELLFEALRLFERDPCSLALVVGSRTCREVARKLHTDKGHRRMQGAFEALKASGRTKEHQQLREHFQLMVNALEDPQDDCASSEGDDEILLANYKRSRRQRRGRSERNKKGNSQTARKSTLSVMENSENWFSRPCSHVGECTDTCPCVKTQTQCESSCACNAKRFSVSENFNRITSVGNVCRNGAGFCRCVGGMCDPEECPCSTTLEKTCDPQRCHCDCGLGPWDRPIGERTCRNLQVFAHKKTFVGRSQEAGFGLFAGELFKKGDLVGVYAGALLPAEIVDGRSAVGDLSNKMYTFDIRNATVDGTTLGAKVRFINHKEAWEAPNCQASEIRVRRHRHHRLTASRTVHPGEEFFFDYKIVDPGTRDDCAYSLPPWLEERRRPKATKRKS